MFMVSSNYKGTMHKSTMRIFATLEEAAVYSIKLMPLGTIKIFLLSSDKDPVLVKRKDYEQWL